MDPSPGLRPGTRIGVYDIVGPLGVGGMGAVYRATDTQLKRQVAIKVLLPEVAQDPERLARFEREAQILAALNHPNIAHIHGLERSDGTAALVLELVEGPTLADRITDGPIPLNEALPIAKQIAEALEAAHEHGIIHRDLKPANIKVKDDGTVKVLDFGLAKAIEGAGRSGGTGRAGGPPGVNRADLPDRPDLSASPTITSPAMMTGVGVLLGTAAYMSPEQAKGKLADKRADFWAFGCVLYEMLTGTQPFAGDDVTDTIVAVLSQQPDFSRLPPETPPDVRKLLRRCLEKDVRQRLGDASAVRLELSDALTPGTAADEGKRAPTLTLTSARGRAAFGVGGLVLGGLLTAGLLFRLVTPTAAPVARSVHFRVQPPQGAQLAIEGPAWPPLAVSASGRLAFGLNTGRLGLKEPAAPDSQTAEGSAVSGWLFWAPDEKTVAFFDGGALKRFDTASGRVDVVTDAAGAADSGTWGPDATIVFGPTEGGVLRRISAAGGRAEDVTALDASRAEQAHRHPWFLPDGRRFLYLSTPSNKVMVGSVADPTLHVELLSSDSKAIFASGYLLFLRGGTLLAQRFDPVSLALSGPERPIANGIGGNSLNGRAAFAASGATLAYVDGTGVLGSLQWRGRAGAPLGEAAPAAGYRNWSLSPDGRQVIAARGTTAGGSVLGVNELWRTSFAIGTTERLTRAPDSNVSPEWSPDGRALAYFELNKGELLIRAEPQGRTRSVTTFPRPPGANANVDLSWSPDGASLYVSVQSPQSGYDIWRVPADGTGAAQALLRGPYSERAPRISPDGVWIAYMSNQSGQYEVFVAPLADLAAARQVSTAGGLFPAWHGQSELFFVAADGWLNAVPVVVVGREGMQPGAPTRLFQVGPQGRAASMPFVPSPDGQRFLVLSSGQLGSTGISVVHNWFEDLNAKTPEATR